MSKKQRYIGDMSFKDIKYIQGVCPLQETDTEGDAIQKLTSRKNSLLDYIELKKDEIGRIDYFLKYKLGFVEGVKDDYSPTPPKEEREKMWDKLDPACDANVDIPAEFSVKCAMCHLPNLELRKFINKYRRHIKFGICKTCFIDKFEKVVTVV